MRKVCPLDPESAGSENATQPTHSAATSSGSLVRFGRHGTDIDGVCDDGDCVPTESPRCRNARRDWRHSIILHSAWKCLVYKSPHLEDGREYKSIHMSSVFGVLQSVACIAMLGYTGLLLHSTSWSARALVQLPLGIAFGFCNGYLRAECLVVDKPLVHALVFSCTFAAGTFVCAYMGLQLQIGLVNGTLSVLLIAAQLPFARNRKLGCCVCIWSVMLPGSLVYLAMHYKAARDQIAVDFQGLILTCIVHVWEALALCSATVMWRLFYTPEINKEVYFALVAITVQSAEALRIVSLLGTGFQGDHIFEDWVVLGRVFLLYVPSTVLFELASRSLCFVALLASTCGYLVKVSPELDVILRCKFLFGYTPLLVFAFTLPFSAVAGKTWILSWTTPSVIALAVLPDVFADILLTLLYVWKRGDSFLNQLKLLQQPGAHSVLLPQRLDFHGIYGDRCAHPTATEGTVDTSSAHEEHGELQASGKHAAWICAMVLWNYIVMVSGLMGVIGQCNFNFADALCQPGV
eukprot:TRINITY_DN1637_c0_g6_i2.p1 TRINITY_DN1637_c0_g6~~TRINITY_DN1637_c0_g6_i2.p1  ORF type:complete len:520 (-),score=36.72 TRINITY_DN1637_c0_g6_i2:107-1666(-)